MAVATVTTQGKPSLLKRKVDVDEPIDFDLPTEASEPSTFIGDYTFLIYGSKKIGKTSLAAQFPGALGFEFEPGGKALSMYQLPCKSWAIFKQAIAKLYAAPHKFKTFVIDTGAIAYERCMEYVCAKAEIAHPGDEGYGKGWKRVASELQAQMSAMFMHPGCGSLILCHDKVEEIETRTGKKYNKTIPDLSGQASSYFAGVIDVIGYYHIQDNKRWLQIREDDYAIAGCRPELNFLTPSGEQIFKIPMGNSAKEAYNNLVKAFNNEQEESYAPDGVVRINSAPVKPAVKPVAKPALKPAMRK